MAELFTRLTDGRVVFMSTGMSSLVLSADGKTWGAASGVSGANLLEGTPLSKEAISALKAAGMPDHEALQSARIAEISS